MLKYFRGKRVVIRFEYNDSLGGHAVRDALLTYDDFTIDDYMGIDFTCRLYRYKHPRILRWLGWSDESYCVWTQSFHNNWEFTGMGALQFRAGGPCCYFNIDRT